MPLGRANGDPGSAVSPPVALPSGNYQKMAISTGGGRIYLTERSTLSVVGYAVSGTSGLVTQIASPIAVPGATSAVSPRIVPHALVVLQ